MAMIWRLHGGGPVTNLLQHVVPPAGASEAELDSSYIPQLTRIIVGLSIIKLLYSNNTHC